MTRRIGHSIGFFFIFLLLGNGPSFAQQFHTEVRTNKSSVFVGEPIEVTIGVFTTTWFTRGVDLGNISVPGTFTVYFRPVSKSQTINGKQFTGVELIYNVFPYEAEDFVFPSLEIEVESPAVGDFVGVKHIVRSAERAISVKPVPAEFKRSEWLVAQNLNVRESWSGNKSQVKVGDVLVREINRVAAGTVPELIPPTEWNSIPGVSQYPSRSEVESNKTKAAISATRIEKTRYLFEKEGEVVIPEKVFTWYNPYQKKLYKRTVKASTIQVRANPNLGVLNSVRDSLQAEQEVLVAEIQEKGPLTILGLTWQLFLLSLGLFLVLAMACWVFGRKLYKQYQLKRSAYLNSELYYFRQFKKALNESNRTETGRALYRWVDELYLKEPSLDYFAKAFGDATLVAEVQNIHSGKVNLANWEKARKRWLAQVEVSEPKPSATLWINPS